MIPFTTNISPWRGRRRKSCGWIRCSSSPHIPAPHKSGRKETAAEYRYQMAKIAFRDVPRCTVSDLELLRESTSYSYQTVERVKRMFPAEELFLIVGGDMLKDFKTWKHPERILAAATLVAASRRGDDADFAEEVRYFRERSGRNLSGWLMREKTSPRPRCARIWNSVFRLMGSFRRRSPHFLRRTPSIAETPRFRSCAAR